LITIYLDFKVPINHLTTTYFTTIIVNYGLIDIRFIDAITKSTTIWLSFMEV